MAHRFTVLVCRGPQCGGKRNSSDVMHAFQQVLAARSDVDVELEWQSCFGHCTQGPNVLVREAEPEQKRRLAALPSRRSGRSAMYSHVSPNDVTEIVAEHFIGGRIVRRLVLQRPVPANVASSDGD